ncbi:MAG: hypothetical protein PVI15_08975 [Chromatiales bacterium]|jgi:hypothetical protein
MSHWSEILKNHTRAAKDEQDGLERVARYAAREYARAEHLVRVLGDVVATIDVNLGKDAEVDELLSNLKTFILHGINDANQVAFKAQRAAPKEG